MLANRFYRLYDLFTHLPSGITTLCALEAILQALQPNTSCVGPGIGDLAPLLTHAIADICRTPKFRLHRRSFLRLLLCNVNTLRQIVRLRQRFDERNEYVHDRPIALPSTSIVLQIIERG